MANEKQVEILMQGREVWNSWRVENLNVVITLSGADLKEVDLSGVDLREADLSGVDLKKANLWGANLRGADLKASDLSGADLKAANLSGADLRGADLIETDLRQVVLKEVSLWAANLKGAVLRRADLRGADLSDANLFDADLSEADLFEANLTNGVFGNTILANNNISNAIGLDKIRHFSPSPISTDTIQNFKGKIPIEFFHGCGLTDLEIEFAKLANPNLSAEQVTDVTYKIHEFYTGGVSFQYYSLFISYSSKDQGFAQKLHDDLQNNGVRCWFAPEDMKSGRKIYQQIDEAIRTHDRLLLILSESSIDSEWVRTEIANARQKEVKENRQVLFPIGLVDYQKIEKWKYFDGDIGKDSAKEIREYFIPEFSNWQNQEEYQKSFEQLLRDLKTQ